MHFSSQDTAIVIYKKSGNGEGKPLRSTYEMSYIFCGGHVDYNEARF